MHHIIPNRYIHPSGGFYSWLFAPDHGDNRTTKLCLGTYLTPLVMTVWKKLHPDGGLGCTVTVRPILVPNRESDMKHEHKIFFKW